MTDQYQDAGHRISLNELYARRAYAEAMSTAPKKPDLKSAQTLDSKGNIIGYTTYVVVDKTPREDIPSISIYL